MKKFKIMLFFFMSIVMTSLNLNVVSAEELLTEEGFGLNSHLPAFDSGADNIVLSVAEQAVAEQEAPPLDTKKINDLESRVGTTTNLEELLEVGSWSNLYEAVQAGYSNIKVTADVTADRQIIIKQNTSIDFSGYQITNTLFNTSYWGELIVNENVTLTLKDFEYGALANDANTDFITGSGNVILTGEITSTPGHDKGFIRMVNRATTNSGTIIFNNANFNFQSSGTRVPLIAKGLTVTNQSNLSITASRVYLQLTTLNHLRGRVLIEKGSVVVTDSQAQETGGYATNPWATNASDITVKDPGTKLLIKGDGVGSDANGGIFIVAGEKSVITVKDQGLLAIESTGSSPLLMNSKNGVFNVDNHSELNLKQNYDGTEAPKVQPVLRFYLQGQMTFNIMRESKISIIKSGNNTSPAIRMFGGNNKINVSGGSDFYVKNTGNGIPMNPGYTEGNAGIQYTGGDNNSFNITGESSNVEIDAVNGTAIDAWDNDREMGKTGYSLDLTATEGTYFVARGNTASSTSGGVINANTLTFNMDQVKYFDFSNRRVGGGRMFRTYYSSTLEVQNSDIAFWLLGDDLASTPFHNWSKVNFKFEGGSLNKLISSSSSNMRANIKPMINYSRMTANNQTPVIEELRIPTNADKAIYGYASMAQAKGEEQRPAYNDEVTLKLGIFDESGLLVNTLEGKTAEMSVYGEEKRGGIFKIPTADDSFLTAGYSVQVLEAWRTEKKPANMVKLDDILTGTELIHDATPPEPAVIDQGNQISSIVSKLTGHGEKGANVSLMVNGIEVGEGTVVDNEGNFEVEVATKLKNGDKVQIFLRDKAGELLQVKNPPKTNDYQGNINPKEDYLYHDANFKAGTLIDVVGVLEIISIPEVIDFGQQLISNKMETYHPTEIKGELEISDTRGSGKEPWRMLLKQREELSNEAMKLSDEIYYTNAQGDDQRITTEQTLVESGQFNQDSSESISNNWSKKRGLKLVVPVEKQLKGQFKGVFSWSLESVPGN